MLFIGFNGVIVSEFLPYLDEGAIWVRGTLAPSTGPSAGIDLANLSPLRARELSRSQASSESDWASRRWQRYQRILQRGIFADLLLRAKWRSEFKTKEDLIGGHGSGR